MNVKEIKELVELVSRRGLAGLEIERAGFRLRIEGAPAHRGTPVFARAVADAVPPEASGLLPAQLVAAGTDREQRVISAATARLERGKVARSAQHLWFVH